MNIFQKRFIITTFEFFPLHIFRYVSAKNMLVCPLLYAIVAFEYDTLDVFNIKNVSLDRTIESTQLSLEFN